MKGQEVDLVGVDQPIHDAVGASNDFAYLRIGEFWDGPARSRRCCSRQELSLHLVVRDQLASFRLPKAFLDLCDEAESLDRVFDGCLIRQCSQGFDSPLLFRGLHGPDSTIVDLQPSSNVPPSTWHSETVVTCVVWRPFGQVTEPRTAAHRRRQESWWVECGVCSPFQSVNV